MTILSAAYIITDIYAGICELFSGSGYNFMRDGLYKGNAKLHIAMTIIAVVVLTIGTIVSANIVSRAEMAKPQAVLNAADDPAQMQGAVPGTEKTVTLMKGQQLDRYGKLAGRYITDFGTPVEKLALPPTNDLTRTSLQVLKPFQVQSGIIAPHNWGLGMVPGGGIQYFSNNSVASLIAKGFLVII